MREEAVVIAQNDVVLPAGLRHEKIPVGRLPQIPGLLMKADIRSRKVWADRLFNGFDGGRCVVRNDDFKVLLIVREDRFYTFGN